MKRYKVCISFGKKVQKMRKRMGISQEKLAELISVHRNHMGRIERGETNPPLYKVYKITKAIKTKSSELLSF